jgi:hypothetical protein
MSKRTELLDSELKRLDALAHVNIGYLVVVGIAAFFVGARVTSFDPMIASMLIGFSGSAIAALTSCLDRYATGFEREGGKPFPEDAKPGKGKFGRRFSRWLFVRPFLGAVVAPVFIWGLSHFAKNPSDFLGSVELRGFVAFMSGLLAKSVLDLIRNLFKNVFRA